MRKPSWDMSVFKNRRQKLAALTKGGAVIIPAHPDFLRNQDVHHPYRADSNLFYLTGFEEPESVLVLRPGMSPEFVMFVRPRDPLRETWDGFRYGPEGAEREFGVDKAFSIFDLDKELPNLLKDCDKVYYRLLSNHSFDEHLTEALEKVRTAMGRSGMGLLPIHDISETLGELRLKKEPGEVGTLRKACDISSAGHVAAMKFTKPGVNEHDVSAIIEYTFRKGGSQRNGYHPIVASGAGATTLHYNFNDQVCRDGDLLLIDAGAEYNYYTGDITRTYPVNGRFTEVQRRFYEAVLDAQKQIIAMVRPGVPFKSLQDTTISLLSKALLELGILKGAVQSVIDQGSFKKYYPHGVSHWLGMDVHDVGLYKRSGNSRPLEAGMCFTIEPGLYVPVDDMDAPAEYRGLGVRIEDNIIVTDNGCDVLTAAAPKEVSEIEAIVGRG